MLKTALLTAILVVPASAQQAPDRSTSAEPKIEMTTYYVVFLRKGPSWTPERTPEVLAIGKGHMDNIKRLAAEGKLIIAGPFLDPKSDLAGLFIFRVASADEARALTETDPAVKAGRFSYEVVPWLGPKTLHY